MQVFRRFHKSLYEQCECCLRVDEVDLASSLLFFFAKLLHAKPAESFVLFGDNEAVKVIKLIN